MSDIVEVGEHQNGQQVELQRGQTLRVTLPEVRTAGFRWSLRTSSQHILSPLADDTNAQSAALGGTAQHRWDFRADEPGTTELVFEYDRPWARAATAARTFSVLVRVTETSKDAAHPPS
ncbi:MAG: protease inhibitor I42 family protein [Candidatus Acidiferrales bacterium]|jgi:predicted secreted protein